MALFVGYPGISRDILGYPRFLPYSEENFQENFRKFKKIFKKFFSENFFRKKNFFSEKFFQKKFFSQKFSEKIFSEKFFEKNFFSGKIFSAEVKNFKIYLIFGIFRDIPNPLWDIPGYPGISRDIPPNSANKYLSF